jgi:azurin
MRTLFAIVALAGSAVCGNAYGQDCSQTIEGNDLIKFNLTEIRVNASCGEVTITLRHTGMLPAAAMGHNWVLAATADYMAIAQAGQAAGAPKFLPAGDSRVLAATDIIGGGQETSVTFDISGLQAGGDYTFFCSFPGHYVLMNGKFIVE